MTKKMKKVSILRNIKQKGLDILKKTIQNLVRIGESIESGFFPPGMVEDFKKQKISKNKMLESLFQSEKGKEKLIFRVHRCF